MIGARFRTVACAGVVVVAAMAWPAIGGVLEVPQTDQELSQWCWAASCEAVLDFYGIHETQSRIAGYGTGGNNVWNYLWGSGTPADGIYRRGCDLIIAHFGSVAGNGFTGVLTAPNLQAEIDAERPVFINWAWDSGGGHIIVARGMAASDVYLMDPLFGPSVSDYDWVRGADGHTWKWTIQLTTASRTTNAVPRWWLGDFGVTNNWDAASLSDDDGDGAAAWEEYGADTSPTNEDSCLDVALTQAPSNVQEIVISWVSSSNRVYVLQCATNAVFPLVWQDVAGFAPTNGTGGEISCQRLRKGSPELFRVRVLMGD